MPFIQDINSRTVFAGFAIAYGTSFQFGYNIGVLNMPSKLIQCFYSETYRDRGTPLSDFGIKILWSLTVAAMYVPGGVIGALLGPWLADKKGRKLGILVSNIFLVIGAVLCVNCVYVRSPELLMLGRVFVGINAGIGNCIAPMFLQEIAPLRLRGAFGTFHQLAIAFGILISSIFGQPRILSAENRWQYLMALELIPVIVSTICMGIIPDSPRFLFLTKGDKDGARRSLEYYRKTTDIDEELREMQDEANAMQSQQERSLRQMFLPDIRKAVLITCMIQIIQQFSGINVLFFYSNSVLEQAGVDADTIPYAVCLINALSVNMTLATVPMIDIAGRRKLLLGPMVGMIFIMNCYSVCLMFHPEYEIASYISVVFLQLYVMCFAIGLGPIPWIMGSELFRQDARSKAMGIAGAVNMVGATIICLAFEPLQNVMENWVFLIFVACNTCGFVFTIFFVPETKGRTFEQNANELAGGSGKEVANMQENVFPQTDPVDAIDLHETQYSDIIIRRTLKLF